MENNTQNNQNVQDTQNTNNQNTQNTNDGVQNNQVNNAPDTNSTEWLDKLDSIINKRIDGLAKSILKDNGVNDNDIKDIISQYNSNKATKAKNTVDEISQLKAENASLKKRIMDGDLLTSANKQADKLNIDKKYISQVLKLADLSKATDGDKINEDALNEAMAKVVEECGVFKVSKNNTESNSGFKNIGAKEAGDEVEDSMAKIRKAMGLK
jgi:hypothetical protein